MNVEKDNKNVCDKVGSFKCIMNTCGNKNCPLKVKKENRLNNKQVYGVIGSMTGSNPVGVGSNPTISVYVDVTERLMVPPC